MGISTDYEKLRKDLEVISEKTRYKLLLTLFASENPLSFSELIELLPSIQENTLNYHLKALRDHKFIKNQKKKEYKRSESRSFYSLSDKSLNLLKTLGLTNVKKEFQALFKKLK